MARGTARAVGALAAALAAAFAMVGPADGRAAEGAGLVRGALVADASSVTFQARDPVGGFSGVAPIASASLRFDPLAIGDARASVTVDPAGIDTGNVLRDTNARRALFDTQRFSTVHYRLTRLDLHAAALPEGASSAFEAHGELTMHGVTNAVSLEGVAHRQNGRLVVDASFPVELTAFGMTPPSFLFITVDDEVDVAVHLVFELLPGGARGDGGAARPVDVTGCLAGRRRGRVTVAAR